MVFSWSKEAITAFENLKSEIANCSKNAWFKVDKDVVIHTDASNEGIAGALLQDDKPIFLASRKLTPVEKRYSTIEKEFLAINFALTKFRRFILFRKCTLQTDHKPILSLINKPLDTLPIRIQKWMIQIQSFDLDLKYIPGLDNVLSDALSRNPIEENDVDFNDAEYIVCHLLKSSPLDMKEIAHETARDKLLLNVIEAIEYDWKIPNVRSKTGPFYSLRDELSIKQCSTELNTKVLMRGHKVVIPESLVSKILNQIHKVSHIGINKMKSLISAYAFWPGYSRDIQDFIKQCSSCTIYQNFSPRTPLEPVANKVLYPYEAIAIDLTGPDNEVLKGTTLLTIIDLFSRYPECYILNKANSSEIVKCLSHSFSMFGIPRKIISDNGPQFRSAEFGELVSLLGIDHSFSSNYFPSSNGCIERFHGTLKSRLKRLLNDQNVELTIALDKVLYDIRRVPNAIVGETPFKLFFNRSMRTDLGRISNKEQDVSSNPRDLEKEYSRNRTKIQNFYVGQRIYYRKGKNEPFCNSGTIVRKLNKSTYEIKSDLGYLRRYNQYHLIPKHNPSLDANDELSLANDAYDFVPTTVEKPLTDVPTLSEKKYNLRPNRKSISVYKD